MVTNDGRTIRYPDPLVKSSDTIQLDIATSKIIDCLKFEVGNLCMITGGHSLGRLGIITSRERHPGSFDIIYIRDSAGRKFSTRFVFGFFLK